MMEAIRFSETTLLARAAWRNISEDSVKVKKAIPVTGHGGL
jgi:hypothetical protein